MSWKTALYWNIVNPGIREDIARFVRIFKLVGDGLISQDLSLITKLRAFFDFLIVGTSIICILYSWNHQI